MSPVGGVGINLAISRRNRYGEFPCRAFVWHGPLSDQLLAQVQKRREWPTKVIQALQVVVQKE